VPPSSTACLSPFEAGDVRMPVDTKDIYWAAGFLEGEGTFQNPVGAGFRIAAPQVQREPLDRLQRMFGGGIGLYGRQKRLNHSDCHTWHISGRAAAAVAMTLYVLMSPKRKAQIEGALKRWRGQKFFRNRDSHYCGRGHDLRLTGAVRANGRCNKCALISQRKTDARRKGERKLRRSVVTAPNQLNLGGF
jgi:hypothetical protein